MPRKKKFNPKSDARPKADWEGFVEWTISSDEKSTYAANQPKDDWLFDALLNAVESGYRVTINYDASNTAHRASLYAQYFDSDNAGWMLSMRADDPVEALRRVLYVHYVLLEGLWPVGERKDNDDIW